MKGKAILRLLCVLGVSIVIQAATQHPAEGSTGPSFSFGAAGDFGAGNNVTATLTAMAHSNLNFAFALGDLSYNQLTPETAWCQYVHQNLGSLPFELLSGNHEDGGELQQGLIDNFTACMPNQMSNLVGTYGQQYYFDYPQANPIARFIMISPGLSFSDGNVYNYSAGGAAYNWVSNAIDSARASGIQWIIVGMHKVCLSTGASACDIGTDILNLLISKHVDLILDGHDHSYQRTNQLDLNGTTCTGLTPTTYNSACVDSTGNNSVYTEGAGTIVNTIGTGGIDDEYGGIYTEPDSPYFASISGTNLNPQKGFVKFTVSSAGITAQFVPSTNLSNFADSYQITATGQPISTTPPSSVVMSDNFDGQATGPLQTGASGFSGANGNVSVVSTSADSPPNDLQIGVGPNGGSYAFDQYGSGYMTHSLAFNLQLGANFTLPSTDYMVLAQTQEAGSSNGAGKVDLIMGGGSNSLFIDYVDSTGAQHYVYSGATLSPGSWNAIDLQQAVGAGSGYLALYVDGKPVATAAAIDTGTSPVDYIALGDEYSPNDSGISGNMYIDDVSTLSVLGFPPLPSPGQNGSISSVNFDNQSVGSLVTGLGSTEFSGDSGAASLAVENSVAQSAPNALQVAVAGASSNDAYEQYSPPGYYTHTLQFSIEVGPDFALPSTDYMTIAQTLPENSSSAGKVSLIMTGGGNGLHLDYVDSAGAQHSLYSGASLTPGAWHSVAIQESVGDGSGSLSFSVDGAVAASAGGIDTGSNPVGYFAIGDLWSPSDSAITGHLYFDNVQTSGSSAPPAPTPTSTSTSTPTATPTSTPSATPTVTPTSTPTVTPTSTPTTTPTSTPTVTPTSTPTTTPTSTPSPTPTPTSVASQGLFAQPFDALAAGRLQVGAAQNQFTQVDGSRNIVVQSSVSYSAPNAVALTLGENSAMAKTYAAQYAAHTLQFEVELAPGTRVRSGSHFVLAETRTGVSGTQPSAEITLSGSGQLSLSYTVAGSPAQTVPGSVAITPNNWHAVSLSEVVSPTGGSVSLLVDGQSVAAASSLNTGTAPVTGFALGEMQSSNVPSRAGTIYFDNVTSTTP